MPEVTPLWAWIALGAVAAAAAAAGLVAWLRYRRRRRVAHYLFTPVPCSFDPAHFDGPKSLFDVAWDLGVSARTLDVLEDVGLLPPEGRLDYEALNDAVERQVTAAGGYRNFVYACQRRVSGDAEAPDLEALEAPGTVLVEYVQDEERRLAPYVTNPIGYLQNRMVAYLYDDAKTAHAKKFGLALAFDYQSFQMLKRCATREIRHTKSLLTYSSADEYDKGLTGAKIKAVASGGGVAALEAVKGAGSGAAATTEVVTGLGSGAAAEVAAEGTALAAEHTTGLLSLGHIAGQFVPIVQAIVLVYGGVHLGRILWRKGQKSNAWLRERKLRGLQKALSERLDALYAQYVELRDTRPPNAAPFAPAHELLALCEYDEQRLRDVVGDVGSRTGGGDLGLLRRELCTHAASVAGGLAKGLGLHLKALMRETDAHLAKGNNAEAALHLFLNKDLIFPPDALDRAQTREIATLAADVATEVRRLEAMTAS